MEKLKRIPISSYPDHIINEVVNCYNTKVPIREIAKTYGIPYTSIRRIALKSANPLTKDKRIEQKYKQIIPLYQTGHSLREIGRMLEMDARDITRELLISNIEIRPIEYYSRKHIFNDQYFEEIDNHTKAQILGMLWADGSVSTSGNYIRLGLLKPDIEYLENVRKEWGAITTPITSYNLKGSPIILKGLDSGYRRSEDFMVLEVCSKKMHYDLCTLGVVPNKTYANCDFPNIPKKYYMSWLLGLIEGDGHIHFHTRQTRKSKDRSVSFLIQNRAGHFLKDYLENEHHIFPIFKKQIQFKNDLWLMTIAKTSDLISLYHLMYDTAKFVMRRKHNKWIEVLEYIKSLNYDIGVINRFE